MARVEELLVFKAIAARSRDIDDAVTLLTLYPNVDLEEVRRRVTELAELAEAPELLLGLDAILRASGATNPKRRKPRKKSVRKPAARGKAPKKR